METHECAVCLTSEEHVAAVSKCCNCGLMVCEAHMRTWRDGGHEVVCGGTFEPVPLPSPEAAHE